jgi:hypothetical protein
MICQSCQQAAEQAVHCNCWQTFCRTCFQLHHCGSEHLARFSRAPDPVDQIDHQRDPQELADVVFRMRPYQQQCVDAILEALQ